MIAHQLNRRLVPWRATTVADDSGGQAVIMAAQLPVRARVSQPTATDQEVGGQSGSRHDHVIYLMPDADVRRGDELRDVGAAEGSLPCFEVDAVIEPSQERYRLAKCRLIQARPD